MTMRRTILMLAGLLTLSAWPTDLVAQRRGPGGMATPTDSVMASYASRLNLTDEQADGLRVLLEARAKKGREMFEAVRGQGREAMEDMRPKMMELQADTNEQIEHILTEDQIPEYRKIQAEIREQRQSRQRQRQPGG